MLGSHAEPAIGAVADHVIDDHPAAFRKWRVTLATHLNHADRA
jgi:hypothetical protein